MNWRRLRGPVPHDVEMIRAGLVSGQIGRRPPAVGKAAPYFTVGKSRQENSQLGAILGYG